MVNQNKTHKQEVSISWECFSSPPDRTRAHRSPMICSSRGSASNTAGNWPIHCLATQQDRKYVYYQQEEQDNQFCQSLSSNTLMCMTSLLTWWGGRSVPASVLSCLKDNPYKWEKESRIWTHCAEQCTKHRQGYIFQICFADKECKTKPCLFPDLINEQGHVSGSSALVGPEYCTEWQWRI